MMRSVAFAAVLIALSLAVCASSELTLPKSTLKPKISFAVKLGHSLKKTKTGGIHNIVAADRARISHIKSEAVARKAGVQATTFTGGKKHTRAAHPLNATNSAVSTYLCQSCSA
jgi:hypothetical protein